MPPKDLLEHSAGTDDAAVSSSNNLRFRTCALLECGRRRTHFNGGGGSCQWDGGIDLIAAVVVPYIGMPPWISDTPDDTYENVSGGFSPLSFYANL